MTAPDQVLELIERFQRRLTAAKTDHDKTLIQRQIDALVHAPYNLTDEKICIVEEATR
jgi:hypothetical protein